MMCIRFVHTSYKSLPPFCVMCMQTSDSLTCFLIFSFRHSLVYLFEVLEEALVFLIQCRLSSMNLAIWLCNFGWMSNCLGRINRTLLSDSMLSAAPRIAKSCGIVSASQNFGHKDPNNAWIVGDSFYIVLLIV